MAEGCTLRLQLPMRGSRWGDGLGNSEPRTFFRLMPGGKRKIPLPDGSEVEADVIGFRTNAEHFNEYLLEDKTVIRLKPVVTEVLRIEGQFDAMGNPMYLVQSTNVVAVDAPDELRRQ